MTMLSVSPVRADQALGSAPSAHAAQAHVAHLRHLIVRDDVPRSYARALDGLIVWSLRDLLRYGCDVRLQGAGTPACGPAVAEVEDVPTRSAAETAAALAAVDTRPLSLDEAMAAFDFGDDGPVSGAWPSEERRLPWTA